MNTCEQRPTEPIGAHVPGTVCIPTPRRGTVDPAAADRLLAVIHPLLVRFCRAHLTPDLARADRLALLACRDALTRFPVGGSPLRVAYLCGTERLAAASRPDRGGPMHRLPPALRDVLALRVCVGLSVPDTAAALGTSEHGVRVLSRRALDRLGAESVPARE